MPKFRATLAIVTRPQTFNPEEKAVKDALQHMGFTSVLSVLMGIELVLTLDSADTDSAAKLATAIAEKHHNPITKVYRLVSVEPID